jgi:hypothetical protein
MVMSIEGFDSVFAPELTDEELRRREAEQNGGGGATSPAGTTETPVTALPGTGTKDNTKPLVNYGTESGGLTPAEQLAQQTAMDLKTTKDQADVLNAQIAQQAVLAQQNQQAILQAQQNASNALNQGFLSLTDQQTKAMAAAEELRKNTGQASRKPNYSVSLKANKAANAGGITSTMLTGPGGVAASALPLGKAAVLGS